MPREQFWRFLLVGAINTAFGYSVFALLYWLGLPYPVAIGLATVVGIAFNFQSSGRLVFGHAPLSRLTRFVVVYSIVYLLNLAMVAVMLRLGLNVYAANAIAILPLAVIAYMLQRIFVFNAP